MKKQLFGLMTILTILSACQKNEVSVSLPEEVTIHATIEEKDATKTIMDESNNILWSENDQIIAFMKSSYGHKYQVISSFIGKSYADFAMVSSGNGSDLSAGNAWDHNVVYYPFSENIECLKSGTNYALEVNLPTEQVYVPDSFANGSMAMVAVSESNNITFKNVLGGIKLQLKGNQTITSIKIEGKNNEKLSGAATVMAYTDENKPAITMASNAATSVTLNCGTGVQLNESSATEFIIALPPIVFSEGFTVSLIGIDDNTYIIETNKANTVLRSSILVMPVVRLNDNYDDKFEDNDGTNIPVEKINLGDRSLTLAPDFRYSISAQIVPIDASDQSIAWNSSDPSVVCVDEIGGIISLSAGTAEITAEAGGVIAVCVVSVKALASDIRDYVDEYGVNQGKGIAIGNTVWAPVNCGYKASSPDGKGYPLGKLYQWGRKYGQGYSTSYDEKAAILIDGPISCENGQRDIYSDYFFIVDPNGRADWVTTKNDAIWNSGTESSPIKTSYEPCPEGWRVPTCEELTVLTDNYSTLTSTGRWYSGESTYI